jgi:type II secretion system protein N
VAARDRLPRVVRLGAIPLAGLLLVLFFVYLGFPYDQLGDFLAARLGRAAQGRVTIQNVTPKLALAGPGIEATGVRVVRSDGELLRIDRARLRPAWSLAWLRGDPALHAEIEAPLGAANGTLILGDGRAWAGDLRGVDLSRLPIGSVWPGAALSGQVDATLDVALREQRPVGSCSFEARQGSLSLSTLPLDLPFETIRGDLQLGGTRLVEVQALHLEGPLLSADLTGSIGEAEAFADAPLRLVAELAADPPVRDALSQSGVRFGRNGKAKLRITGTPSQPSLR